MPPQADWAILAICIRPVQKCCEAPHDVRWCAFLHSVIGTQWGHVHVHVLVCMHAYGQPCIARFHKQASSSAADRGRVLGASRVAAAAGVLQVCVLLLLHDLLHLCLVHDERLCSGQLLHGGCQGLLCDVERPVCCVWCAALVDLRGQRHRVQRQVERSVRVTQGALQHVLLHTHASRPAVRHRQCGVGGTLGPWRLMGCRQSGKSFGMMCSQSGRQSVSQREACRQSAGLTTKAGTCRCCLTATRCGSRGCVIGSCMSRGRNGLAGALLHSSCADADASCCCCCCCWHGRLARQSRQAPGRFMACERIKEGRTAWSGTSWEQRTAGPLRNHCNLRVGCCCGRQRPRPPWTATVTT